MFFQRKIVTYATDLIETQPVSEHLANGWRVKVHSTHVAVQSHRVLHYTTFIMRRFIGVALFHFIIYLIRNRFKKA